ncbi:MAG: agmatinase [Rickettsiales bacterium]|jgi:agmatinase|nr:agmatinase [Rickettsiales bacterium]
MQSLKGPWKSKNFIGSAPNYKSAETIMVGLPFDGTTTNRPGTRFAYSAIVPASREIEENSRLFGKTMDEALNFFDAGELDLPKNRDAALGIVQENVAQIYEDEKRYFGIGGEHLLTLPAIISLTRFYKPETIAVVHFDAHGDMADDVYGEAYSHGAVMRRISEFIPAKNIRQIGIRSAAKSEWEFMEKNKTLAYSFSDVVALSGKNIFVSLDVDCLDPSVMPGTGTPVPGGLSYNQLASWVLELGSGRYNIIGADMVELSPPCDASGMSTNVATYLAMEMLFMMARGKKR